MVTSGVARTRKGLVQDPRLSFCLEPPAGAQGPEEEAGPGHADDVRGRAGRGQPLRGGQRLRHDRAHGRDGDLGIRGAEQRIGARHDLTAAAFPGRVSAGTGQLLADRAGRQARLAELPPGRPSRARLASRHHSVSRANAGW